MEQGTPLTCEQCQAEFTPKNRNGVRSRFCTVLCKDRCRNARRLRGAALLMDKKPLASRPAHPGKRRVDLEVIPAAERPALLLDAAKRLGLTEEGPMLKAARQAAQSATFSLQSSSPMEAA